MEPNNLSFLIAGGCFIVFGQIVVAIIGFYREKSKTSKLDSVVSKLDSVASEQRDTKHELNSRLTELVETVRIASKAAGVIEGRAQQRLLDQTGKESHEEISMDSDLDKIGQSNKDK